MENKDNLMAAKTKDDFLKGIPRYDYAKMAAPKDGAEISVDDKQPVTVRRRVKTSAAAGGC